MYENITGRAVGGLVHWKLDDEEWLTERRYNPACDGSAAEAPGWSCNLKRWMPILTYKDGSLILHTQLAQLNSKTVSMGTFVALMRSGLAKVSEESRDKLVAELQAVTEALTGHRKGSSDEIDDRVFGFISEHKKGIEIGDLVEDTGYTLDVVDASVERMARDGLVSRRGRLVVLRADDDQHVDAAANRIIDQLKAGPQTTKGLTHTTGVLPEERDRILQGLEAEGTARCIDVRGSARWALCDRPADGPANRIFDCLKSGPKTRTGISDCTGLPPHARDNFLLEMEASGDIQRINVRGTTHWELCK